MRTARSIGLLFYAAAATFTNYIVWSELTYRELYYSALDWEVARFGLVRGLAIIGLVTIVAVPLWFVGTMADGSLDPSRLHVLDRTGIDATFDDRVRAVLYALSGLACLRVLLIPTNHVSSDGGDAGEGAYVRRWPLALLLLLALLSPMSAEAKGAASPSTPARPRALTSEELSARGLLGRFQGLDPELYGRIWRVGRDPRSCAGAQYLALVDRAAIPLLTRKMNEETVRSGIPANFIADYELALADMLEFDGRTADAERLLKQRLATPLRRIGDDAVTPAQRLLALQERLARLYTSTRPIEAERLLQEVAHSRIAANQAYYKGQTDGYPAAGPVWQFYGKLLEQQRTASAERTLAPFYRSIGRTDEAIGLYRAALAPLEREAREQTDPAHGPPGGIDELKADIARASAEAAAQADRVAEAERLYRDCCGASPAYARLLLSEGKRDEARVVLSRMMIDVAADVEDTFDCMTVPLYGDPATGEARAKADARDVAASQNVGPEAMFVARVPAAAARLASATELGELLIVDGLVVDATQVLAPTLGLQSVVLGADHPATLRTTAALARATRLIGQHALSVQLWSAWLKNSGAFLHDRLWSVNEDDRRRFFRDDRRNVDAYLATLRDANPMDGAKQALAISLRHKGLLASVAGEITSRARSEADPKVAELLAQLRRQRGRFAALVLHDKTGSAEARLARRQMDEIEAQLASALPATAGDRTAAGPEALVAALKPGDALIDFQVFRDPDAGDGAPRERMVAVLARAGTPAELVWWDNFAPIRAAAARFRMAILSDDVDARRTPELHAAGRALYDLLWRPLAGGIADATRIFLAPDDILDVVPLAALPDDRGRPLIAATQLVTLSALRDLLAQSVAVRSPTALVIGNPAFGGASRATGARGVGRVIGARGAEIVFAPLPGTLIESRSVNALLGKGYASRLLEGAAATKAAVTATSSPTILHLATHGFFLTEDAGSADEGDPLVSLSRSGLALANANLGISAASPDGSAEGVLTALDAVSLELGGTKLVVLSACETGLGEIASGEGVYGLAEALHQAGAQAVLATLWPVSDEATAAFMQDFYAHVAVGEDPQAALRAAQLAFVQSARWTDPVFWAPFVLTGR